MAEYPQGATYIFSGKVDSSDNIIDNSLIPMVGRAVTWSSSKSKELVIGKTNSFGCIRSLAENDDSDDKCGFFITNVGDNRRINLIDDNVFTSALFSSDGKSEEWSKRLISVIKEARQKEPEESKKSSFFKVKKIDPQKHLVKLSSDTSKKHFDGNKNVQGILISRFSHLVLFLPSVDCIVNIFQNGNVIGENLKPQTIKIKKPQDNAEHLKGNDNFEENEQAVLIFSDKDSSEGDLVPGVYTVEVINNNSTSLNYFSSNGKKEGKYKVSVKVDFNVKSLMGDFAIVDATPISLEESIFTQYSAEYEHIRDSFINNKIMETPGKEENSAQSVSSTTKSELSKYINLYKTNKSRIDLLKSTFGDDDLNPLKDAIIDGIKNSIHKDIKKHYDFVMSVKKFNDTAKATMKLWKFTDEILALLDSSQKMTSLNKFFTFNKALQVFNDYGDEVAKTIIKNGHIHDFKILAGDNLSAQKQFLLKTGKHLDPEDYLKIANKIDAPTPSLGGKVLGAVEIAVSATELINQFIDVNEASRKVDEQYEELIRVAKAIDESKFDAPVKAAWQTMEKNKSLLNMGYLGLAEKEKAAAIAAFDAAIAVLSVIPVTSAIGIILGAIKGAADAGWELIKNSGELIETHLSSTIIGEVYSKGKIIDKLNKEGKANFRALKNVSKEVKEYSAKYGAVPKTVNGRIEQIAVRTEAIRGLVALIQRISCKVYEYDRNAKKVVYRKDKLNKNVQKYEVKKFIETYLLKPGWLMPKSGLFPPVGLDEVWYLNKQYENYNYPEYQMYSDLTDVSYANAIAGIQLKNGDTKPKGTVLADFQKEFPIQTMYTSDVNKLTQIFSRNYTGVYDYVRYSQIYYRIPEENDGINDGWVPIVDSEGRKTHITTKMQLRILIVLNTKDDMSSIPASFQLRRVESLWADIKGPEYKVTCQKLSVGDGGLLGANDKSTCNESGFKDYVGIVFFPFYIYKGNCIYGPKPLEYQSARRYFDSVTSSDNKYQYIFKFGNSLHPVEFDDKIVDYKEGNFKVAYVTNNYGRIHRQLTYIKTYKDFPFYLQPQKFTLDLKMCKSETFLQSLSQSAPEKPPVTQPMQSCGIAGLVFKSTTGDNGVRLTSDIIFYPKFNIVEELAEKGKMFFSDKENIRPGMIFSKTYTRPYFWIIYYVSDLNENEWLNNHPNLDDWAKVGCKVTLSQGGHEQTINTDTYYIGYLNTPQMHKRNWGFIPWKLKSLVNEYGNFTPNAYNDRKIKLKEAENIVEDILPALQTKNFAQSVYCPKGDEAQSYSYHNYIYYFASKVDLAYMENGKKIRGLHRKFKPRSDMKLSVQTLCEKKPFDFNRQLHCLG